MTTTTATKDDRQDAQAGAPIPFPVPGPGSWQQDPAHFPRTLSAWAVEAWMSGFPRGFSESTRRYGLLLDHLAPAVVNGFMYYRAVPAVETGGEAEVHARMETARAILDTRLWRDDLELWDREVKPDSIRRNRSLQSVRVADLSDAELAGHLEDSRDNLEEMVYRHHKFNMAAILPVGDLVASVAEWTGRPHGEILSLLRGASPVTRGVAAAELRRVGEALREAGITAQSFPADLGAGCVLERLRATAGPVGEAVEAYLDACGWHIAAGYDVTDLNVIELPDALVQNFWRAAAGEIAEFDENGTTAEAAAGLAGIRNEIPAERREAFDALVAEARVVYRLRDERGLYNDLWAAGLARRAILEAGRRLALRGKLDHAELIFEASCAEAVALLTGRPGPSSAELERRGAARRALPLAQAPAVLGDEPPPPPPLDGLPPHSRRAERALAVAIEEILGFAMTDEPGPQLRGKPVSAGVYEGRARVISGPADFNRLASGDVLVTVSTSAAFNVVLPLLGAIVTDRGALLSHAAIVSREYGIPGVVGTRNATTVIPDGSRVRVDGTRGIVEVLS